MDNRGSPVPYQSPHHGLPNQPNGNQHRQYEQQHDFNRNQGGSHGNQGRQNYKNGRKLQHVRQQRDYDGAARTSDSRSPVIGESPDHLMARYDHRGNRYGQRGGHPGSAGGGGRRGGDRERPVDDGQATPGGSKHNSGRRGQESGKQRKKQQKRNLIYEPYWSREELQRGLKQGSLVEGALRINPRNYKDSYIPHPDGHSDIYISGLSYRNRALNGDIVAVLIFPKEEWRVLEDELDLRDKTGIVDKLAEVSINAKTPVAGQASGSTAVVQQQDDQTKHSAKKADPKSDKTKTGAEGAQKTPSSNKTSTPVKSYRTPKDFMAMDRSVAKQLFCESSNEDAQADRALSVTDIPEHMLMRTGKVVSILEKKHSRACTGHLKLMQDKNKNTALFCPIDHKLPRILVPMEDCPQGFYERPDDHTYTLFVGRISEWREDSGYAHGLLARSLGEAGEIEPETECILIDNDINNDEFSTKELACLPQNLPWTIPPEELAKRRDLRDQCIFTIDPATARDLDDALSCNSLGNGVYEVGVHIADVSYFVKPDNPLDDMAKLRATSVYLEQMVIPMLPRLLCEKLCSLNPDEDRLAFSVIWTMTEQGEIIDEWFGRSVFRSCAKLSYDHAQGVIENPTREWRVEELPPISTGFTITDIRDRILDLNKIALNLRKKRFTNGALRLDQVKIKFTLDKETGMPCGYSVYEQKDSNRLVEEFMLLANMAVAHKIYKAFPEIAILRRHPPPQTKMIDDLVATCKSLGVPINASSAGTLQQSIAQHAGTRDDSRARFLILTVLASKPMQNARYFCTGCIDDEALFHHYALNVPLYTHFTSPIRRYPDIMVHRLLAAALGYTEVKRGDERELDKVCKVCNDRKQAAKLASKQSSDLFFAVFLKACGPLEEEGMVMAVLDRSFDVLVLKLGVVKRVYCEKLPLKRHHYIKEQKKPVLTLEWSSSKDHPQPVTQTITIFTKVNVQLVSDKEPLKWTATVLHPGDTLQMHVQ